MPLGGAGGQNVEYLHTQVILSSFFKCILVLLARRSSGELRCSATALIVQNNQGEIYFPVWKMEVYRISVT